MYFCYIFIGHTATAIKMRTSLTIMQFYDLLHELPTLLSNSNNEDDASDTLFMYLMKIRTGASNAEIGTHFAFSQRTIGRRLQTARTAILNDFVPRFVNYSRTRDDLIGHCTKISRSLFDPNHMGKVILILDGTYIFIEKSQQHEFQKQTYNSHKKRNYIKIMNIVTTDGTIVGTFGPFEARQNDACIMEQILDSNPIIFEQIKAGDDFLVDRGFQTVVTALRKKGINVQIPASEPNNKQLSTKDANDARKITKLRFEVEHMNGMIKNVYRIFQITQETYWIPTLMNDYTIAAALMNRYMVHRKNHSDDFRIANSMLQSAKENIVHKVINSMRFSKILRKKEYATLLATDIFPNLTKNDLEEIAFGRYQVMQAQCYAYDHIKANQGEFYVDCFEDSVVDSFFPQMRNENTELALLMTVLRSRFKSAQKYRTFVLINRIGNGSDSILGYCCSCKVGARTIGCCSHVMTMIYYLGYAQYNGGVPKKAKHLHNNIFFSNCNENNESVNDFG